MVQPLILGRAGMDCIMMGNLMSGLGEGGELECGELEGERNRGV